MFSGFKQPRIVLAFILIAFCASVYYTSGLRFDYDFESFFPDNDPALPFYLKHRKTFGYDNEFVLIGIENQKGIFEKDFLTKVKTLSDDLKKIRFSEEVVSPLLLKKVSFQEFGLMQIPLLHYENPELYKEDSAYIYSAVQWKNNFFAKNAKSLCIFFKSTQGISKVKSDSLADVVRACVEKQHFEEVHYAGRIFAQEVFLNKLHDQFFLFLVVSFFLISFLLWFFFRKAGAVILPVSLIFLSILFTFGVMGVMHKPIDIMAIMIPSMIFVAGMSDVVHFYTKYSEEMGRKKDQTHIFKMIYKEVAGPTFLTLISTVAGFLSLCYSGVKPIRDFGIYTSVGISIAFILTYTYLPAMLVLFPVKRKENDKDDHERLDKGMQKLFRWVIRNGKMVGVCTVIVMLFSLFGLTRLKSNQAILEDLPNKETLKKDLMFFEKNYGGVRPLEIAINVKDPSKSIWDYKILRQIDLMEHFIEKVYHPGFLASPASLVKTVNMAYNNSYSVPADTAEFNKDVRLLRKNKHNKQIKLLVTSDGMQARFTGKIRDAGSAEIEKYNNMLSYFFKNYIDTTALSYTITGTTNLLDINNKALITNTMQGLLTGVGVLALLTLILHRSLKMMVVFLIPNVVPLVLMAGLMGLCGIELKSSTAIFFSIAFGIATDDTIHFISRFRLELNAGYSPLRAFRQTYFETGKAVFLTTLILVGGFISLILSDFQSIYLFGLLTAITLFIALLSEIFLLPVLLTFLFKSKKDKSLGKKIKN
jgi:hydrophobe/amphiphile efflux-3 (HAE3) family protein